MKDTACGDWIKLHRKMLENPVVCKDADHLAIWVYLLLNAVYKEAEYMFDGKKITLQKGQLVTSKTKIAKALNISDSKVHRVLSALQSDLQIEQQGGVKMRLITVLNWEKYQDSELQSEPQNEPQVNHKRTTSEPLKKKERNSQLNILKNKLLNAGAYAGKIHNALIDEVAEALAKACDLERPLTFNKKSYGAEDFRRIADGITVDQVCRVVNSLLSYKDGIENREIYILGILAERSK